jgi:integrase
MGTIFRKRGKWYVNYVNRGERHRIAIGTSKRKAKEVLRKIEGDIINETFNLPVNQKMRFSELADYWLENHSKVNNAPSQYQKNRERIDVHLIPNFGNKDIRNITPRMIDEYKESRLDVIKPATINRTLAILRKMFNDAVRWGFLASSPMKAVRQLHEAQKGFSFYNGDEVKSFLANCSDDFYHVACCAVYTGMRKGEIVALEWEDVDLERKLIRIERSGKGSTKSKKVRYVPINSRLLKVLLDLKSRNDGKLVFPDEKGRMRTTDFRGEMRKAANMAGLKTIRFHDLRHTFASNYVIKGGNIVSLQKIIGHSTVNMTMRYAHLSPDFMAQEIEALDFDVESSPDRPQERIFS